MSIEQVKECLTEMPHQSETAQGLLLEELQETTIEISDSEEPTKEVSGTIETSSEQPDTGSIVIDEPDKGDYHFHFE